MKKNAKVSKATASSCDTTKPEVETKQVLVKLFHHLKWRRAA
jgi:hypothetical protein